MSEERIQEYQQEVVSVALRQAYCDPCHRRVPCSMHTPPSPPAYHPTCADCGRTCYNGAQWFEGAYYCWACNPMQFCC